MTALRVVALLERRARALAAIAKAAVDEGEFMGRPWVMVEAEVEPSDHNCGPDCACWKEEVRCES